MSNHKFAKGDVIYCPRNGQKEKIFLVYSADRFYKCDSQHVVRFDDENQWELFVQKDAYYIALEDYGQISKGMVFRYDGNDLVDSWFEYYSITKKELERYFDRWDIRKYGHPYMYVCSVEKEETKAIYIISKIEDGKIFSNYSCNTFEDKIYRDTQIFSLDNFKNIVPASYKATTFLQEKLRRHGYKIGDYSITPKELEINYTDELTRTLIEFDNKIAYLAERDSLKKLKPQLKKLLRDINKINEHIKRYKL